MNPADIVAKVQAAAALLQGIGQFSARVTVVLQGDGDTVAGVAEVIGRPVQTQVSLSEWTGPVAIDSVDWSNGEVSCGVQESRMLRPSDIRSDAHVSGCGFDRKATVEEIRAAIELEAP